jgi:lipopolysaccharide biosynthesis glycosyltransferase
MNRDPDDGEGRSRLGMMHVALASNEGYFPGMACAILSLLEATGTGGGITLHILDGGIEPESWEWLKKKVASLRGDVRLARHPLSLDKFDGFPLDAGNGVMTYARILMPSLIEEDEVIYVDSDLLLFRDLRDLWETPMNGELAAACQDVTVKVLANDSLFELSEKEAQSTYFNSGFMKVNLKLWREEGIPLKVLRLVKEHGQRCTFWDQTALNACLKGRVMNLDRQWNRQCFEYFTLPDFSEDKVNIHFVAKSKPWMSYASRDVTMVVWRMVRAKWMPQIGRLKGGLEPLKGKCYDLLVSALGLYGSACIRLMNLLCAVLKRGSWNPALRAAKSWLEKQRTKVEILRFMGSRLR